MLHYNLRVLSCEVSSPNTFLVARYAHLCCILMMRRRWCACSGAVTVCSASQALPFTVLVHGLTRKCFSCRLYDFISDRPFVRSSLLRPIVDPRTV